MESETTSQAQPNSGSEPQNSSGGTDENTRSLFADYAQLNNTLETFFEKSVKPMKQWMGVLSFGVIFLLYFLVGVLVFLANKFPFDAPGLVQTLIWPLTMLK